MSGGFGVGAFGRGAAGSGPAGPGWKRTGPRDWEHSGPLTIGKEKFPYGGIWIGRRPTAGPRPPWTPKPPGQKQLDLARRAAEARAAQTAQRLAEQARARKAADRSAAERQRTAQRARKRNEDLRRQVERTQQQAKDAQQRTAREFQKSQDQRNRRRQQRNAETRRAQQLRQQREAQRKRAEQARRGKFTGVGDYLASLVPPLHRLPAMRRPILGAPFAKTGLEALANLKKREAFAGNFAMENVSFWSSQVAQVVGSLIGGVGELATVAKVASMARVVKIPFRAPPGVSVAEIGAGDLRASIRFQKMGAHTIAVEPDPQAIAPGALQRFQAGGGRWLGAGKTATDLGTNSVDHVVQYFPWEIGGTGRHLHGGTWNAAEEGIRAARKTVTFVSDDADTARFLVRQAQKNPKISKVAWIKSTAREAAPGATGSGLRGVRPGQRVPPDRPVDLVIVYLAD